jgi:hypothetical protein
MADEHSFGKIKLKPKDAPPVTFRSAEELQAWIATERQFWAFVGSDYGDAYERTMRVVTQLDQALSTYVARRTDSTFNDLKNHLSQAYESGRAPHSTSALGRFIAELQEDRFGSLDNYTKNTQAQAALLYLLTTRHVGIPNVANLGNPTGVVKAILFERGLADSTAHREALETLHAGFSQGLSEDRAAFEALVDELKAVRKRFEELTAETVATQRTAFDTQIAEATKARDETGKKLDALEQSYDEHMALKSPVSYWRKRQYRHAALAGVAAALAALVGWKGYLFAEESLRALLGQPGSTPGYGAVAGALLLVTLFLWVLRILSRVCLGSLHLSIDSGERAVMATTYLALIREGSLQKDDKALGLVLASLFRHSSSGLIKDDAGPNTPLDVVSRLLTGK